MSILYVYAYSVTFVRTNVNSESIFIFVILAQDSCYNIEHATCILTMHGISLFMPFLCEFKAKLTRL